MRTYLICILLLLFSNNPIKQLCAQVISQKIQEISNEDTCFKLESLSDKNGNEKIKECCDLLCKEAYTCCNSSGHNGEDEISEITIAVNAINNVLTWSAVVVAIITLFVAILGILGFREIKNDCEKAKKAVEEFDMEIRKIGDKTKALQKKQDLQYLYVSRINKYIYEFSIKIANANEALTAELLHDYHLINLLSVSSNYVDDFNYLKANGTEDDVELIEFIARHDDNEEKKKMAREAIGYIRGRLSKPRTSTIGFF